MAGLCHRRGLCGIVFPADLSSYSGIMPQGKKQSRIRIAKIRADVQESPQTSTLGQVRKEAMQFMYRFPMR
jgi:hypothetical protein